MTSQRITSIRFAAKWTEPLDGTDERLSLAPRRIGIAQFHLGRGPCGKTVTSLKTCESETCFAVQQDHDDGTSKTFAYQWSDILGRIEIETGPSA